MSRSPPRLGELAALARSQHGLFTGTQARGLGVTRRMAERRVAGGEWCNVERGVYRIAGAPPRREAEVLAAILATNVRSVASHATAAHLLGLHRVGPVVSIELCALGTTLPLRRGVRVHRTRRLEPCDTCVVEGVPVTSGARTLVDLAARLDAATLTALVDDAICAGRTSGSWLYRRAVALRGGRRGVGRLIRLTAEGAEGTFRSWLERRAAWVLRSGGIRRPRWNVPVYDRRGMIGLVDALFPPERVVVEFEGMRFHTTPEQRERDAARFNRLVMGGYTALRYGWSDVVEQPGRLITEVRHALGVSRPPP
ncbi:MAG: DUF559 domain-containing protein [Actinobacteria bacterium]|nr:DUF559 domain-containing protein [Actinomycetota bacterium]